MTTLSVNGQGRTVASPGDKPLLWVLRDELNLTGCKFGCGVGVCGACLVLLDDEPHHACRVPLSKVGERAVTTIEGLPAEHPVIQAWIQEQVPQCGYCQPAQIMAAAALLSRHPQPDAAQIGQAMAGVLCRCGTYQRVRRAIDKAAAGDVAGQAHGTLPLANAEQRRESVQLNPWIAIARDNTAIVTINHSEMGQGALTGLAMLFAEELELGLAQLRAVFAPADPRRYKNGLWGSQFTGGSSSIRGEWIRFRQAAAETRARLVETAAETWRVQPAQCRVNGGHVHHPAGTERLAYAQLAAKAAKRPRAENATLKPHTEFRLIGRRLPRMDIPAMCRGRIRYGIDVKRPRMLTAVIARCPVFGGSVAAVDAAAARRIEGVRQIVHMDHGVAVIGDDYWSAEQGRQALEVQWDAHGHDGISDAAIEAALNAGLKTPGSVVANQGDALEAMGGTAAVHSATYYSPCLAHATIEPMNCVAEVGPQGCDVWVGTQDQQSTQAVAAEITGLPKRQVRVHTQFLGGGFGRRLETDFVAEAVSLAKASGRPIQVIWNRADDLQHDSYRPAHAAHFDAVLNPDGYPLAWFMRAVGDPMALGGVHLPYAIEHYREERVDLPSPVPAGAWRSVEASNNAFAIECFMDELAHAAGKDPLDYRLAVLHDPRHRAVLSTLAEVSHWGSPLPAGRGRGMALYDSFGSITAQAAEVSVDVDGIVKVHRVHCVLDCGIAVEPDAVVAQMEGGIAFGLSAALKEAVNIQGGSVTQAHFEDYPLLTLDEMPEIAVVVMDSDQPPGGVGEPGVPPIAPAVANALFAATGRRHRRLPLNRPPFRR